MAPHCSSSSKWRAASVAVLVSIVLAARAQNPAVVQAEFVNSGARSVVLWFLTDDDAVEVAQLAPGEAAALDTFEGHTFRWTESANPSLVLMHTTIRADVFEYEYFEETLDSERDGPYALPPGVTITQVRSEGLDAMASCTGFCQERKGGECLAACDAGNICECDDGLGEEDGLWAKSFCDRKWATRLCVCEQPTAGEDEEAKRMCGYDRDEETTNPNHLPSTTERLFEAVSFELSTQQPDVHEDRAIKAAERCHSPEIDARSEDGREIIARALDLLRECGVVAIRGALNRTFVEDYRDDVSRFVHALHNGADSADGSTSKNEASYLNSLSSQAADAAGEPRRWNMLLPLSFASWDLLFSPMLRAVLTSPRILGAAHVLHSLGTALSEGGAATGSWHVDSPPLFGAGGGEGHSVAPFAITVLVPLLNLSKSHGPTEFCLGSSHLSGLHQRPRLKEAEENCDPPLRRWAPELGLGDVCLFDYKVLHRGGANTSPQMRTLLYYTFSRPWYSDWVNWDTATLGEDDANPRAFAPPYTDVRAGTPAEALTLVEQARLGRLVGRARVARPYAVPGDTDEGSASADEAATRLEDLPFLVPRQSSRLDLQTRRDAYRGVVQARQRYVTCDASAIYTSSFLVER